MIVRFAKTYYKAFLVIIVAFLLLYVANGVNSPVRTYANTYGVNFFQLLSDSFGNITTTIASVDNWFSTWYIDPDKWYAFLNMFNTMFRFSCEIVLYMYGALKFVINFLGVFTGYNMSGGI